MLCHLHGEIQECRHRSWRHCPYLLLHPVRTTLEVEGFAMSHLPTVNRRRSPPLHSVTLNDAPVLTSLVCRPIIHNPADFPSVYRHTHTHSLSHHALRLPNGLSEPTCQQLRSTTNHRHTPPMRCMCYNSRPVLHSIQSNTEATVQCHRTTPRALQSRVHFNCY